MKVLKNKKKLSHGTFFKNLGSPFLKDGSQDYSDGCFLVISTLKGTECIKTPKVIETKK